MVDYKGQVTRDVSPIKRPDYARFSGLYFFLSLDLVNSTAYKAENPDWKFRIRMFYDEAKSYWSNHQSSFRPTVWKHAGDEVLFYARVRSVAELERAIVESSSAMKRVGTTVEKWSEKSEPQLYVKGTCWCANAEYEAPAPETDLDTTSRNIVFWGPLGTQEGQATLDFLGPEIDIGFRIASASAKKALVVSAEVAGLLYERDKLRTGLRVVDYRELKGVWGGRHYPIVWYRADWKDSSLNQDYHYDDRFRNAALDGAYNAAPNSCKDLSRVLGEIKDATWLQELNLPATAPDESEAAESSAPQVSELEVHAVAICFTDEGQVLIAQRPTTKRVASGCWEAGCAKLRPGDTFVDAMKRDYLADFRLALDFEPFAGWGVVGTYSLEKSGRNVPGVLFVARVIDGASLSPAKHADARWADPERLGEDVVKNCVPNLPESIRRAFGVWKNLRQGAPDGATR